MGVVGDVMVKAEVRTPLVLDLLMEVVTIRGVPLDHVQLSHAERCGATVKHMSRRLDDECASELSTKTSTILAGLNFQPWAPVHDDAPNET